MLNRPMLLDLHPVYVAFRDRMRDLLERETVHHPIEIVIGDFFQIAIHRASDCITFFEDAGTQKLHLHPIGLHRIMVSSHMQDILFDEFNEYVFECSYFDNDDMENRYVHHQVASYCVHAVGEILQAIMVVIIQTDDGRIFFHPDNATLDTVMTDLIIDPIPNRRDVKVTVRFE